MRTVPRHALLAFGPVWCLLRSLGPAAVVAGQYRLQQTFLGRQDASFLELFTEQYSKGLQLETIRLFAVSAMLLALASGMSFGRNWSRPGLVIVSIAILIANVGSILTPRTLGATPPISVIWNLVAVLVATWYIYHPLIMGHFGARGVPPSWATRKVLGVPWMLALAVVLLIGALILEGIGFLQILGLMRP